MSEQEQPMASSGSAVILSDDDWRVVTNMLWSAKLLRAEDLLARIARQVWPKPGEPTTVDPLAVAEAIAPKVFAAAAVDALKEALG